MPNAPCHPTLSFEFAEWRSWRGWKILDATPWKRGLPLEVPVDVFGIRRGLIPWVVVFLMVLLIVGVGL